MARLVSSSSNDSFFEEVQTTATVTVSGSLAAGEYKEFSATVNLDRSNLFGQTFVEINSSGERHAIPPIVRDAVNVTIGGNPIDVLFILRLTSTTMTFVCALQDPYGAGGALTSTTYKFYIRLLQRSERAI